ncbi:thioredoxin domain-containing protein 3-like [Aricia agestis]|uniref:thioredoxin domain-containing protein 3-like n=1 Tax=Aricia agestis TaxID=91739 RepID=UPI001C205A13|nr:thioredoxin domain-containing protein 3-like [Aricia agestis]
MALTHAVAHGAAAAAAAGAGKKAAQVQLQAELNTDDDFAHFLQRDGLLVVDVYTEWCGPCLGMVGNLKKIKVELGGDNMHLAVAKSDTIECLKRFRNRSEPTWMFLAGGQLLNVVFGADAPRIARTIEHELRQEELVRRGEQQRVQRAPHELTPHEQEAADAKARAEAARREREAAAAAEARTARREARARSIEPYFGDACPALLLPHAQKHLRKVTDALEPFGVVVADKCPLVVGREVVRALAAEEAELGVAGAAAALVERPSLALLLKKLPDREGDVIELSRRALFGDGVGAEEDPPKRYVGEELRAGDVPGLFVPADRHQRAAVLDLLFPKTVSAVSPPPAAPPPPHVAVVCGAWQRRAALAASGAQLLCYGFFADASIHQPRLLCKTLDQYEDRPEKD